MNRFMVKYYFLFVILLFSCSSQNAISTDLYKITLPDSSIINAEIAKDKAKGLQNRDYLCSNCGMIFVFDSDGFHSFWMKDTLISLALIWMDSDGKVVHIVRNAKPCEYEKDARKECQVFAPKQKAKYVLEILPNASSSIQLGSKLNIEIP